MSSWPSGIGDPVAMKATGAWRIHSVEGDSGGNHTLLM